MSKKQQETLARMALGHEISSAVITNFNKLKTNDFWLKPGQEISDGLRGSLQLLDLNINLSEISPKLSLTEDLEQDAMKASLFVTTVATKLGEAQVKFNEKILSAVRLGIFSYRLEEIQERIDSVLSEQNNTI